LLIVGLLFFIGFYIYAKNYWKNFATETQIKELISEIKTAEELPEKFYELYEIENPNTLTYGLNRLMITSVFKSTFYKPPSSIVALISEISRDYKGSFHRHKLREISLSWKIENGASQRECLNWVANRFDFVNMALGIKQASNLYFKKEISELTEKELASLVIMMNNASLYNPLRRKELLDQKADELVAKIK